MSEFSRERLEICISDNSANNDTQNALDKILKTSPLIKYRRSLDAPSLDENAYMVSKMASGKFIWFFGDDDLLVVKELDSFLHFLSHTNSEIILVNSQSFYNTTLVQKRRMPVQQNLVFNKENDDAFMELMGGYLTYLPCITVNRKLWLKNYNLEKQGTFFAHIDCIMKSKIGVKATFYANPLIKMRLHSQTWSAMHFQIWNIYYPEVIWGIENISDTAKHSVIQKNTLNSIGRYLSSRANNRFNFKLWQEFIRDASEVNSIIKLISLLISILPVSIFRSLFIIYIKVFRNKQTMQFCPDLALAMLKKLT